MSNIITPNMQLVIPGVGSESGPTYAFDVNSSLTLIDQHTHAAGSGVPITPSALNISSDLTFISNNAIDLRSVRFTAQASALALPADLGCLYESGVDLYYNDGAGNQIRLTQGGSIVGTAGSITGLPSGTASASYTAGTFVWQAATATPANMDFASAVFRNNSANSKGLTLSPPNSMAADYALVLPNIPASQKIMTLDASGNMSAPYTVDGTTITIAANVIAIPTDVPLPGQAVTVGGRVMMVANYSSPPRALGFAGIRALGDGGTVTAGGGITYTQPSPGVYILTFSFATTPVISVVAESTTPFYCTVSSISGSGATVNLFNAAGVPTSGAFNVSAVGIIP